MIYAVNKEDIFDLLIFILFYMKKILIAVDYTQAAEKVARVGYELAKSLQGTVALIHVITEPVYYAMEYSPIVGYQGEYTSGTNEVVEDVKNTAGNFLNAMVQQLGDNSITTAILDGDTTDAIIQYSTDWNADLIVLGSHTHHGLERLFSTDVAAYILKHSTIPVLAVPTDGK